MPPMKISTENHAEKPLQILHALLETSESKIQQQKPPRSLRPKHETPEDFLEESLPPAKNYFPGKRTITLLNKGSSTERLLQRTRYLQYLNRAVIPKVGFPYSQHLRISSISRDGIATVHADSPAWAQRGRFLQREILDLLHQEKLFHVKKVIVKVRPKLYEPKIKLIEPQKVSMATAKSLEQESEQCDGELGTSLHRLSTTLLRKNWSGR